MNIINNSFIYTENELLYSLENLVVYTYLEEKNTTWVSAYCFDRLKKSFNNRTPWEEERIGQECITFIQKAKPKIAVNGVLGYTSDLKTMQNLERLMRLCGSCRYLAESNLTD